jgi:hypothetical protein
MRSRKISKVGCEKKTYVLTYLFICLRMVVDAVPSLWRKLCELTYRKYSLKQGNRIGVRCIKYDVQGVFLECAEVLPTRLFDNVED